MAIYDTAFSSGDGAKLRTEYLILAGKSAYVSGEMGEWENNKLCVRSLLAKNTCFPNSSANLANTPTPSINGNSHGKTETRMHSACEVRNRQDRGG